MGYIAMSKINNKIENEKQLSLKEFFSFLLKKATHYKWSVFFICFANIYKSAFTISLGLITEILFNNLASKKSTSLITIMGSATAIGFILFVIIELVKKRLDSKLGVTITNQLRQKMLEHK